MDKMLVMTPELTRLNTKLEYFQHRLRTAILGIEARFYRALIRKTQGEIETLVLQQISPDNGS